MILSVMGPISLWLLLVFVVGVALLCLGLRGDPSRGRRRCRKCWHSMEGLYPDERGRWTCPECGTVATKKSMMLRRRRFKLIALCGVLLVLSPLGVLYAVVAVPRVHEEGGTGVVPSTLLVVLTPDHIDDDTTGNSLDRAIIEAIGARQFELWDWQAALISTPEIPIASTPLSDAVVFAPVHIEGEPLVFRLEHLALSNGALSEELIAYNARSPSFPTRWSHSYPMSIIKWWSEVGRVPAAEVEQGECAFRIVRDLARDLPFDYQDRIEFVFNARVPSVLSVESALQDVEKRGVMVLMREPTVDLALADFGVVAVTWSDATAVVLDWLDYNKFRQRARAQLPGYDFTIEVQLIEDERVVESKVYSTGPEYIAHFMDPTTTRSSIGVHRRGVQEGVRVRRADLDRFKVRFIPRPDLTHHPDEHDRFWAPADGGWFHEVPLRDVLGTPP